MPVKEWDTSFSVGVNRFDNQHMRIFELLNQLHAAMKVGVATTVLNEILQSLLSYTETHFAEEESLMLANGYPGTDKQKLEHKVLLDKVLLLQQQYLSNRDLVSITILKFLYDWLVNHIKIEDKLYGQYFNAKGIY